MIGDVFLMNITWLLFKNNTNKYRYDSKLGYTLSALQLNDIGAYKCVATDSETGQTEERLFYLQVMRSKYSCYLSFYKKLKSLINPANGKDRIMF